MTGSQLYLHWNTPALPGRFRTGVSLHSHTSYSEESLGMIPRYTANVPWLGAKIREQAEVYERHHGEKIDFGRAFWTPPLTPREAWKLEASQIEDVLNLHALVSLSDHDNIQAGQALAMTDPGANVPISVEWTIPTGPTFFHVGVHNLPPHQAPELMARLAEYTAKPRRDLLAELFAMLNALPEVLVILNHPLWDESGIGQNEHARWLGRLLERHGESLHALELNGLRSWKENLNVVAVGRESGHPVISGGDRHGVEPNAILNLTNASTFAEFVHEVRHDRVSDVLFMPQFREPLRYRVVQTMWDIVREYPEAPEGRKTWADHVFWRYADDCVESLSQILEGREPAIVKQFLWAMRLVDNRGFRRALRQALADGEEYCL